METKIVWQCTKKEDRPETYKGAKLHEGCKRIMRTREGFKK